MAKVDLSKQYSLSRYVVWNDATCDKSGRRFFCTFSDVPVFHLRGLSDCQVLNSCPFSFSLAQLEAFDYKFKWTKTSQKVVQRMEMFAQKQKYTKHLKLTTGSIHPGWVPRFKDLLGNLQ